MNVSTAMSVSIARVYSTNEFNFGWGVPLVKEEEKAIILLSGRRISRSKNGDLWVNGRRSDKSEIEAIAEIQGLPCARTLLLEFIR
jgi:hypothetical protein